MLKSIPVIIYPMLIKNKENKKNPYNSSLLDIFFNLCFNYSFCFNCPKLSNWTTHLSLQQKQKINKNKKINKKPIKHIH